MKKFRQFPFKITEKQIYQILMQRARILKILGICAYFQIVEVLLWSTINWHENALTFSVQVLLGLCVNPWKEKVEAFLMPFKSMYKWNIKNQTKVPDSWRSYGFNTFSDFWNTTFKEP